MMKERECRVGERRTNEGGDGFTLGVLGVGDGVSDDVSGREEKEGGSARARDRDEAKKREGSIDSLSRKSLRTPRVSS